jgi:hypothetical protein
MGIILLTTLLTALAVVALLFMRGSAGEPVTHAGPPHVPVRSAVERAEQLIHALGFQIDRRDPDEGTGPGFVAHSLSRTNPQRIYVRAFELPPDERVRAPDVIAAVDVAKSEGFNKMMLVSPTGFTDEAVLAADDTVAELIDDARLDQIMKKSPR